MLRKATDDHSVISTHSTRPPNHKVHPNTFLWGWPWCCWGWPPSDHCRCCGSSPRSPPRWWCLGALPERSWRDLVLQHLHKKTFPKTNQQVRLRKSKQSILENYKSSKCVLIFIKWISGKSKLKFHNAISFLFHILSLLPKHVIYVGSSLSVIWGIHTVDALRVGDLPRATQSIIVLLVAHQGIHSKDSCRNTEGTLCINIW